MTTDGSQPTDDGSSVLEERAKGAQMTLDSICGSEVQSRRVVTVAEAIASQHADGSWGSDDFPRQKPCYTAQIVEMIMRLSRQQAHDGRRHGVVANERVQRALAWLRTAQHADGSWGEDAWDTCHVLRVFDLCGISSRDLSVRKALDALRACVDNDWPDHSSYWFGPCFHGGAMEAFNRFNDVTYAKKACDTAM